MCGGYENAQLENIRFANVSGAQTGDKYAEIVLKSPSRLLAKPRFDKYGFIVQPGDYALAEFSVKVARSRSDVGHLKAGEEDLLKDGVYQAGMLTVAAGEVVYVGHFGLDCFQGAMPWRYYVGGEADFVDYVSETRKKFRFLKDAAIISPPVPHDATGPGLRFPSPGPLSNKLANTRRPGTPSRWHLSTRKRPKRPRSILRPLSITSAA